MYGTASCRHCANVIAFQVLRLHMDLLGIVLVVVILLLTLEHALVVCSRSGVHECDSSLAVNEDHEVIAHVLQVALADMTWKIQRYMASLVKHTTDGSEDPPETFMR